MDLLDKLKSLTVRKPHGKSIPPSQMLIPKPVQSGHGSESGKKRVRPAHIPVAVIDIIIMTKPKSSPLKTLQSLPTELLIQIATLLAPIDRASLAFTSSWLHGLFGNATKLNGFDRWKLLKRLEQSNMWPSEILCEICQKFHEPRKSRRTFTQKEGQRACIRNGASHLQRLSISPYLFEGDSFRCHGGYIEVSPFHAKGATSRRAKCTVCGTRILFPGRDAGREANKIIQGTGTLHRVLQETSELGTICGHARWADIYPFITRPDEQFGWHQGQWSFRHSSLQEFDLPGEELQECLWTHKGDCWVNCQARARLDSALEGRIWSCGGCSTDYAVNIIRSESSCANYIVMTSWKDVGTCIRRDDRLWKEHMNYGVHAGHKREEFGKIAGEIEKLTRGPGRQVYYFPRISKKRLREMFINEGGCEEKMITRDVEVDS
ncbi:hypothetical protein QSH57_002894 [Fusarium oxysporum f. sp. vasinfectum]|nr:hypothetical protein QSH57_002894 [Fusarium oxysporum f. sp. vasinfectum]